MIHECSCERDNFFICMVHEQVGIPNEYAKEMEIKWKKTYKAQSTKLATITYPH